MSDIPDSISHPKKRAFLENYPKFRVTELTADAIGSASRTVRGWLASDEVFNTAFTKIKKEIDAQRLELYEQELDKRALFGSKQSDILLMFGLKALNRDKYGDRVAEAKVIGDITIKMAIPPYQASPQISVEPPKELTEGKKAAEPL